MKPLIQRVQETKDLRGTFKHSSPRLSVVASKRELAFK